MLTQPAISALVGWWAYGETLSPLDWVGAVAIGAALGAGADARAGLAPEEGGGQLRAMDEPATPLEQIRRDLALATGEHAVFDGWGRKAVEAAAAEVGIDRDKALLAMPRGRAALVDLYVAGGRPGDRRAASPRPSSPRLKIRETYPHAGLRRGWRSWPRRARRCAARSRSSRCRRTSPLGARIGWRAADMMWRLAGDTATDYNHYTKRMMLGAVYGSTLLVLLDDESEGLAETARLPRPPDRRRHAVREMEGRGWKGSGDAALA